ncbi:MAG TPA: hypothetical protein V6C97_08810 [Oculatellaceae cyanobacterium]
MSGPLPTPGYISNTSRTVSDAQNEWELDIAVAKETLGGTAEGSTLSITSNTITPVNNYCVYPVDASGGGTINTIAVTNMRDGQVIFLHCVTSSDPITIANMASGSGVKIATFSGNSIVLTNPAQFVALKYSASANLFQEMFPQPNWSAPGPIGSSTASSGTFTSLSVTGNVAAHTWFGNNSGGSAAPSFSSIGAADLPASVVTSSGNLSPLFTASISAQALSFSLSAASAGALFGNFSGSSATPSFNAPGSADQVLGVAHSGGGLEYKTISAGSGITISRAAGAITLSLTTPVAVANGGTGASSLAGNGAVIMNSGGTAQSTVAPGANGNVLTSNGTSWTSAPPSGGGSSFPDYFSYTYFGGL